MSSLWSRVKRWGAKGCEGGRGAESAMLCAFLKGLFAVTTKRKFQNLITQLDPRQPSLPLVLEQASISLYPAVRGTYVNSNRNCDITFIYLLRRISRLDPRTGHITLFIPRDRAFLHQGTPAMLESLTHVMLIYRGGLKYRVNYYYTCVIYLFMYVV